MLAGDGSVLSTSDIDTVVLTNNSNRIIALWIFSVGRIGR